MSRSIKTDYEKLQNPGNTRNLVPYTVRQCICNVCKRKPYIARSWVVRRYGVPQFTAPFWNVAQRWATGPSLIKRMLTDSYYGKGHI